MGYDVIVVGGSFAGLSAAQALGRARRSVLVIDGGQPRNRFAAAAHNIFGHDGTPPARLFAHGRAELARYPTVEVRAAQASGVAALAGELVVTLDDGSTRSARRLVLATGLRDSLPDVPGLATRWGTTVLHCPYCHGFEVADRALGVLANHPGAAHQALLLPDWGPTTYFTQGRYPPDADTAAKLAARGVVVEHSPVVGLVGKAPALDGVRLADGRILAVDALFTVPASTQASPFAADLGCAFDDGPLCAHVRVDAMKQTTVPGVYAAGDAASPMHSATTAIAAGVLAGVGAHQSLVAEAASAGFRAA
ncbi:NAD(P)/FAD-dependent oxidoreductase [Luteimonas deserti]|uniref:NAD(P)/FAD-dependent oxidoreductase n=1 Tax=Luteimonas deserti TaxID=2752306 RepID=A0A7Z0QN77_9GAMM|nr:NAD(P)/FAD-dependent oxidoreductase [Luteimonas deserti]NYZ61229.1 NAD(P)/FAD-dependent oxidoreductase [Luteimonas deserti]